MNHVQKEICDELMNHTVRKSEVRNAMVNMFAHIDKQSLCCYIDEKWETRKPKGNLCLRDMTYKEKKQALDLLLQYKSTETIKGIYFKLTKCMSKELSVEMYNAIIGKNYINEWGRETLRGQRVEFMGFSPDGIKIIVQPTKLDSAAGDYMFSIYDINCRGYIEII